MTAAELIALLKTVPPETEIFVWNTETGDRLRIAPELDPWANSDGVVTIADINTVVD